MSSDGDAAPRELPQWGEAHRGPEVVAGVGLVALALSPVAAGGPPLATVLLVALLGTVAVVIGRTGTWRQLGSWASMIGLGVMVVASGLVRERERLFRGRGEGQVIERLDPWVSWLAVGGLLVVLGIVLLLRRPSRANRASAAAALAALVTLGLATVLARDIVTGYWIDGRPHRRRGRRTSAHVLPVIRRAEDHWRQAARDEAEAAVAFRSLAVRLRQVGAPTELARWCERAEREEAAHARRCARLAGIDLDTEARRLVVDPPAPSRSPRPIEIVRLAVESYVDGVIGEAFAAGRLRCGGAGAPPGVGPLLLRTARDEDGHADLARAIVRWCLAQHPVLVARSLEAADRAVRDPEPRYDLDRIAGSPRELGLIDRAQHDRCWRAARRSAAGWLAAEIEEVATSS